MEKKKKGISEQDRQRNNNFAAAFDYLRRNLGITTQGKLAKAMGVNKDTITNILNYYTPVTEDKISKLMAAFEGVFNLQYLRGESDTMLAGDVTKGGTPPLTPPLLGAGNTEGPELPASLRGGVPQAGWSDSDAINALLAAKDDTIMFLRHQLQKLEERADRELANKDAHIADLEKNLEDLRQTIRHLQNGNPLADYPFKVGVADNGDKPSPRQEK